MTEATQSSGVGASFDVTNPATGEVIGRAPDASRADLDAAMAAASSVGPDWAADDALRSSALLRCAELLEAAADELASLLTAEQGKPLREAGAEVGECVRWFRYFGELALEPEQIDVDRAAVRIVRRPCGVVAAITPWNFPLSTAIWKVAPALRAGNTMVLKPSPFTPLTTLRVGELLADALPAGVLRVITGGDELGEWMTTHPVPQNVSFTGSTATGKRIAAVTAPDLKRLTLELGGNDPAVVLDDVDVDAVARRIFWGAFYNCGQVCAGIKRVYAPQAIAGVLAEALGAYASTLSVGNGAEQGVRIGPVNNAPQLARVAELVDEAVAGGARVVAGGERLPGDGLFFAPTILSDLDPDARVIHEEQFGPVLPVIPYATLDEAIEKANATEYGLGASVWSADEARAAEVAVRLQSGTAWINTHAVLPPSQPFAGTKWSGLGVENGIEGLRSFTVAQVLHRPVS